MFSSAYGGAPSFRGYLRGGPDQLEGLHGSNTTGYKDGHTDTGQCGLMGVQAHATRLAPHSKGFEGMGLLRAWCLI